MIRATSISQCLAAVILLFTQASLVSGQEVVKQEGKIVSIDPKTQKLELSWVVSEIERIPVPGGTKAQPNDIFIEKAVRTEKAKYQLAEKHVVRFTQAPIFVDANGKERKATGTEYTAYRGNGNQPGFRSSPGVILKERSVTLVIRKDEVTMILVTGSEKIEEPKK